LEMTNTYQDILEQHKKAIRVWSYNKGSRLILKKKKEIIAWDTETTGLLFHTPSILFDDSHRVVQNPFPFGIRESRLKICMIFSYE